MNSIIEDILGEPEHIISDFKMRLTSLLESTQIEALCETIPNLNLLFFSTPKQSTKRAQIAIRYKEHGEAVKSFSQSGNYLPFYDAQELKNKYNLVIHLLQIYRNLKNKPLCIFLDNLQWTDYESINLVKEILGLGTCETFPFLLIGVYRNREIKENTPLGNFLKYVKPKASNITEIVLSELSLEDCNSMVASSLKRSLYETISLTRILFEKTRGNPFYLKQLLVSLYKSGKIFFNNSLKLLSWNLDEIQKVHYTQNVVDFLLQKFAIMNLTTKKVLAFASCIGSRFAFNELRDLLNIKINEFSIIDLKETIDNAIKEGWLSYVDSKVLQFNHDRLQQAANQSLKEKKKMLIHYVYGKRLLRKIENSQAVLEDHIFDIIAHLNYRANDNTLLNKKSKRNMLLQLNALAASKAINSGAIEQARNFVSIAKRILHYGTIDVWNDSYDIAFKLLILEGNCEYETNLISAASLFNQAIDKSKNRLHLFEACYYSIMVHVSQGNYEDVFEILKHHLFPTCDELKFLSCNPNIELLKIWISDKMHHFKLNIIDKITSKYDILELPDLTDAEQIYIVNILGISAPALFLMKSYDENKNASSKCMAMIILLLASEMVLTKGLCPLCSMVLSSLGWYWNTIDLYPKMTLFIDTAIELARNRYKDNNQVLSACLLPKVLGYFLYSNVNAIEVWRITEEAFLADINCTHRTFGGFSILWHSLHHFFYSNNDIRSSIESSKKAISLFDNMGNLLLRDASQMILDLKCVLSGEIETFNPVYKCDVLQYPFFRQLHHMFKGICCYFQQMWEEAFLCMEKSYEFKEDSIGLCSTWIDAIFQGLIACTYENHLLKNNVDHPELFSRCKTLIDYSLKTLDMLSTTNPLVFKCSFELVTAEHLFCKHLQKGHIEDTRHVISSLNSALKWATRERNHFILKLVNWRMGEIYKDLEMENIVVGRYLSNAFEQFNEMGASIIVNHIWESYKEDINAYNNEVLGNKGIGAGSQPTLSSSSCSSSSDSICTTREAFLSLTQTYSESDNLDFKEIFVSILPLLSQHTDASRCCLVLKRESGIFCDAEYSNDTSDMNERENNEIEKYANLLPLKSIYRTFRTRNEQLSNFASGEQDTYFEKNHIASALCLPIIRDNSVVGCMYLENRDTEGVFTTEKVNIAKLIISISIENAEIFNSINKSYTRFLPYEFLKLLGKNHVTKIQLGDAVSREMTVLFSDIYGFTDLMERLSAKEGFNFINRLLMRVSMSCCLIFSTRYIFSKIGPPISKYGGFIDKILGDGML